MHKHIIAGESAAGCLRMHLHISRDDFVVFNDSLIIGPLLLFKNEETFLSKRAYFWKKNSHHKTGYIPKSYRRFFDDIKQADSFTLWLAPGANDQIMWSFLVYLFELYQKDWRNVQVKHLFSDQNSKFPYISLSELSPEKYELCADFEITEDHLVALRKTYEALCHKTPELLVEICNQKNPALPALQASLKSYLKFYPNPRTGLGTIDEALLSQFEGKRYKSARIVAGAMFPEKFENRMLVGDQYVFYRLLKLSQLHCKYPLVNMHGAVKTGTAMRFTEVELTVLGQAVLEGKKNQIELNGINEQIGGVTLSSKDDSDIWFYNGERLLKKNAKK